MHIVHIEQRSQHETWLIGGLEHEFYFSIQLGMSSSQLTSIFFRGVGLNHQPDDSESRSHIFHHFSAARASGRITWPAAKERLALSAEKWRLEMGYPGYPGFECQLEWVK